MQEVKDVVWGLDGLESSVLELKLDDPVEEMDIGQVKALLHHFDTELSFLEEETDLDAFLDKGGKDSSRKDKNKEAERRKLEISAQDGLYSRLLDRFEALAINPLDLRAVELRKHQMIYDLVLGGSEFNDASKAVGKVYREKQLQVNGDLVGISKIMQLVQGDHSETIRRAAYFALRELDDLEASLHAQVGIINGIIRTTDKGFTNIIDVRTYCCESVSSQDLKALIFRFVNETKSIFNALYHELISDTSVNPWDSSYLSILKDPFSKLNVPQDPKELFNIALSILVDLGYERNFIKDFYNPERPGVFLDIEQRDGKKSGAATFSLGPFSKGKNMLYYDPTVFVPNPRRRWTVFPHELGHGIHHEFSRREGQDAIFYDEPVNSSETFSFFHESAASSPEALKKYLGINYSDASVLAKWELFKSLAQIYTSAAITLGEIGMHVDGPLYARERFFEAETLTRAENIRSFSESSSYTSTPHLHAVPGYYLGYFLAHLNQVALTHSIKQELGTLFHPKTARILTEKLMIGNVAPIHERIASVTGISDTLTGSIEYFRTFYSELNR